MNINAAIIDQRLNHIIQDLSERASIELNIKDESRLKSLAFTFLCIQTLLDISGEEAFEAITDGGNDFGVDGLYIGEENDNEFVVTLFQCKYKKELDGNSNFPENSVKNLIRAVTFLFDPSATLSLNRRLLVKIEEVRSRIREGYIPKVRVLLCNNGLKWNDLAQVDIDQFGFEDRVTWEHVNHDRLLSIMQSDKPVIGTIRLQGKAIVEDFDFSRVLIGKVPVTEVAALIEQHGDRLLDRNIRRYLGLHGNRVNEGIRTTLSNPGDRANFYFYNNGITLICSKFEYNALQHSDFQVRIEGLQIINGGQTSNTIARVLKNLKETEQENLNNAFVLIRLYQLPHGKEDFVEKITYATNSQNPVDLKDLRANDAVQKRLEVDLQQLGYTYRRLRSELAITKSEEISSATAAEAILSVLRKKPHQAKFLTREHFGQLYEMIFSKDLTGAEVIIATLLYRIAENKRKRPEPDAPDFVSYASCFLAMRMGEYLYQELQIQGSLTHQIFPQAKALVNSRGEAYFRQAQADLQQALSALYRNDSPSLQRLSATFRRVDLIDELAKQPLQNFMNSPK